MNPPTVLAVGQERPTAQEELRIAFADNPVGQLLIDLSGERPMISRANRAIEQLLGYSPGDLNDVDIFSLMHPEDAPGESQAWEQCLADGDDEVSYRTRRRHRSGRWIPVHLAGRVVREPVTGAPRYALASVLDITAELEASAGREAALILSERGEELARALSEIGSLALSALTLEDLIRAATKVIARAFPDDLCAAHHRSRAGQDLRLVAGAGWDPELLAGAGLTAVESSHEYFTLTSPDLVVVSDWHAESRFRASPLLVSHGVLSSLSTAVRYESPVGVIAVHSQAGRPFAPAEGAFLTDAAQLLGLAVGDRDARAKLEQGQRTLQALVDNAPAAIYVLDQEGAFTLVSQAFEGLVGASREAILGRPWDDLPHPVARLAARHKARDMAVLAGDSGAAFEEEQWGEDGVRHYLSVDFPLLGRSGEVLGLGGISTDVTALKAAEAAVHETWREMLRRIANAVEYRDEETGAHIERMSRVCGLIADELGFDHKHCADLVAAAVLHDAGKIAVPDRVLRKPGRFTEEERQIMETHCQVGHDLLAGSGSPLIDLAASIAWTHHERYDGTGYPRRLEGAEIPIEGRIAAVADVFDALTNDRVYRPAVPWDRAVAMMREQRGRHFDPEVLDAFLGRLSQVRDLTARFADINARQIAAAARLTKVATDA